MTTLNLDDEIVATRYDAATKVCIYTLARDAKRWTVTIPAADLAAYGTNAQARREHLARTLIAAMLGLPDPPAGTKDDPAKPADWTAFAALKAGTWYVNPADGALQMKSYE